MGTSILLVIPIVGLAIDASFLYMVKARLSAAADAAALAAARNLNVGISMADQEVSARNRATAFFNANFPDNYLRTENKSITVSVAETGTRVRTVRVDASVIGNTWFMRYLGFDNLPINTTSTASRRDVNLILVLDRSGSMQNSSSCEPMKSAAQTFVNGFANERDRIGRSTRSPMRIRSTSKTLPH
jgi:Flp pilus assembly protein TadG